MLFQWILRPEYIDSCSNAGQWQPEEEFEWSASTDGALVDQKSGLWLGAARKWRLQNSAGLGPYSGYQISIVGKTEPPREQLERLLIVGRGAVVSIEENVAPDGVTATRLVVAKEANASNHDVLSLAQSTGAIVVKPRFLLDLISMEQAPSPVDRAYVVL